MLSIEIGHHIKHEGGGWCHTLCPEKARGVLVAVDPVEDEDEIPAGEHAPGPIVGVNGGSRRRVITAEQRAVIRHNATFPYADVTDFAAELANM